MSKNQDHENQAKQHYRKRQAAIRIKEKVVSFYRQK